MISYLEKRQGMVQGQIKARGVADPKVLQAMLKVQRHLFVPENFRQEAYEDYPLSIGCGQTISQPYIVAYMIEAVRLDAHDKVLEIGTGCGYQAAVLAEIVQEVYSVDVIRDLAGSAKEKLRKLGYVNIYIYHRDGFHGLIEHAPFDAIIVSAAPAEVPQNLINQMKTGGRMVIPVGLFSQELYLITKQEKGVEQKRLLPVQFVPMVRGKNLD